MRRLFRIPAHTPELAASDANDQLRAFLDERVEHSVARGMTPDDARAEALRASALRSATRATSFSESAAARERTSARANRSRSSRRIFDLPSEPSAATRFTASAIAIDPRPRDWGERDCLQRRER